MRPVNRRGWVFLGTALLGLAAGAAWLLRPRPPEPFPLVELVPNDAVVYAGFPDYRLLESLPLPGKADLAKKLDPARPHLAGPVAVYVDRFGEWVCLARLTRASALVAGAEVVNGAAVVASSPEALARHREREGSIADLDAFRKLGSRIFVNLDALNFRARRDFPALGFELVSAEPLVLRGRALMRGELYRLYVERYLQAPRHRPPEGAVGAVIVEPPVRFWDDALLVLNPVEKERVERVASSLSRDFLGNRGLRDFIGRLGPSWSLRVVPTPHGAPAAVVSLDLPDPETRELLPKLLHKVGGDVGQYHRNRNEAPPFDLALQGGLWHVRFPRAAELRLGEAFSPAYAVRDGRWTFTTCADVMELPLAGDAVQGAVRIDVPAAFALARGLLPLFVDGEFRDEAGRSADALFAKAYGPETQAALKKQMPDAAELRRFLAVQRSKLAAKALEEISKTPRGQKKREELQAELDRWAGLAAGVGRIDLDARYTAEGIELEVRATPR
jgi:hypothetical protein